MEPNQSATPSEAQESATSGTQLTASPDGPVSLVPGESYATGNGWPVTLEKVAVQVSIVRFGDTHHNPAYADNAQHVVADVVVSDEDAPDPANLDVSVQTDTLDQSGRTFVATESNTDDVRQRFGFAVPVSPTPNEKAIVWTPDEGRPVRWELPTDVLTAIARPPEFELREFEAHDVPEDEIETTVTVENVGASGGTFLAEVGDVELSDQEEGFVDVPSGETVTVTKRLQESFGDQQEMTVILGWRDMTLERTIERS